MKKGKWASKRQLEGEVYLIRTLHLPSKDAAIGDVDAERFADELRKVEGSLIIVHGFI